MTLRQKFSVLVFGCAVLTALVLSLFSYVQLKSSLMNNINSEVHATAVGQAGKIKEWKESKEATIKGLADYLVDHDVSLEALQQATTAGRFELGYFGSETGEMFQNDPSSVLPADYDPRKRPWYGDAKKTKAVIFTDPYVGASAGYLMITAAQSVYRNGKLIGVAGADIPLEAVTQGVLDIELGGEGRAILTNKAGLILADSVEQNRNKTLKDAFGFDLAQLSADDLSDVNGHFVSKFDIADSDWVIVFVLDKGHVLAPLSQLLTTLIIAAVVVAFIVAVVMSMLSSRLLSGVTRVNQVLKEISQGQGDLTVRIPVHSDDEIGQLGKHFNTFLGSMSALVTEIKTMSTTLNSLAHQSKDQAVHSQKELRDQLDEITMVATAVSQMSSATHEIASNAENTAGASQEAARNTQEGSRVVSGSQQEIQNLANEVTQASDIISNLDVHVQGISSILLTIQDIAEKTNLLALNAAIEAARAGEQGRGFAVVADEVRVLSQRTQSSTEEIRDKIEGLNSVTSRAVASMKRSTGIAEGAVSEAMSAANALESIQSSVQKISDMAMQIASAAEEQNIVTHDISNNSASIKEISEKLSKEASSTAKAAEQFATLADRLEQQIARFIV